MASSIGSVDGPRNVRRTRRKRWSEKAGESASTSGAGRAEAPKAAPSPAAVPPPDARAEDAPPMVSAQLMGQTDSAEGAAPANSAARAARKAYLKVEWSGPQDRRTRRGRIAKTEV
jgi:hypothetical protein